MDLRTFRLAGLITMKSFGGPKSTIYAWITFFDLIEIKNISIVKWHVPCS